MDTITSPLDSTAAERAEQDQRIAELINAVQQIITQIRSDDEVVQILAGVGYGNEKLEEGMKLCEITQERFNHRQIALNTRKELTERLDQARYELDKSFSDYRVVARAMFDTSPDRGKLGVSGRRPDDLQKLLTAASAAFKAAQLEPYTDTLSRHGFDLQTLSDLEQQVNAVRELASDQNTATKTAIEATRIRDEAADELQSWVKKLRAVASRHLREVPNAMVIFEA